ncbi:MAG: hypothetical protein MJ175_08110 [Clostridia bacterium]|nr:hypothetical protein [Clostridia bacterium]
MNPWKRTFTIAEGEFQFVWKRAGTIVFDSRLSGDILTVSMLFSSHEQPLCLRAEAHAGQRAEIVCYPYRIELYIDGVLCDEEWPFGDALADIADEKQENVTLILSEPDTPIELPAFCGTITQAEGWRPGGGVFAGDCMPYTSGNRYHVLYLKDRHHHRSKWGKGAHQWEHISTEDLLHWDIHPMAVPIDDPAEGSICTGSWIREGNTHYLYYTVRTSDGSPAPIRRSVSEDGYHFRKDPDFHFILSDRYTGASARDPKVVKAEDGSIHMFVTTTDRTVGRGCLVHLISHDGEIFREMGNIYTSPDENEPECSDYFFFHGRYYLIFSHHGRGEYRVSDQPFSDWKTPAEPMIPCSSVPKCAVFHDRVLFTGFRGIDGYAGTLTFMEAGQKENGELFFFVPKETK